VAYKDEKTEKHLWINKQTASMLEAQAKKMGISQSALASNIINLVLEGRDIRSVAARVIERVTGR